MKKIIEEIPDASCTGVKTKLANDEKYEEDLQEAVKLIKTHALKGQCSFRMVVTSRRTHALAEELRKKGYIVKSVTHSDNVLEISWIVL